MAAGDAAGLRRSTPASATSPRRASTARISRALQVNLLRSHAAGVGEPLPPRAVRAMMALRANVLAKGYSGIRRRDARRAAGAAQPRRAPARADPRLGRRQRRPGAARAPRARAHRRRASTWDGRRAEAGATALAARGPRAGDARPEGGPGAHQRHAGLDRRCWPWRSRAPSGWRAPPTSPRRSPSTRCAARAQPFDPRIHAARAVRRARRRRPTTCGGCSRAAPLNQSHADCGRVQDAYSDALRAAGARRGARGARLRPPRRDGRDERRHRQPDGVRRRRRDRVGRQLPRRAGRARRRPAGDGGGAAGDDQRAPLGAPGQPGARAACRRSSRGTAACSRA